MRMAQIGVQAMMLKQHFAEEGVFRTLREVSDIGYHALEVSQLAMTVENVNELTRAREELGMNIAALSLVVPDAASYSADSFEQQLDEIVADAKTLDVSMVRIGMIPRPAMASLGSLLDFCDRSNAAASRLSGEGISLYYHNHHIDFSKYDGRYLLDVIADRAPMVGLEVDVHWVQRGGLDPVAVLKKYAQRVAMVHLKDYRIGRISDAAFVDLAAGDGARFSVEFRDVVQFAEVGEGNLDFTTIIDTSLQIGVRYLLVEQDLFYGRTAMDCLRISHDNLVALGYGYLFAPDSAVTGLK